MDNGHDLDRLLTGLRAAGEETRLRLLAVCAQGEWTVSELCQVIGQSQPRVSRHLKLLAEAGLLERFREGSWVFYRRAQTGSGARVARSLCRLLPERDPELERDRQRLAAVRAVRRQDAARWFDARAEGWDHERDLSVDPAEVDAALASLFGDFPWSRTGERRCERLLDVGTGTGRVLQRLAPLVGSGLGVDSSHDMLRVARANLDRADARNCQVRHGDMYQLPADDGTFSAVTLHQVLHFADDPEAALAEAARVLQPGGLLAIVDLAHHEAEWLRTDKAHRRLGFTDAEFAAFFAELGLTPRPIRRVAGERFTICIWSARKGDGPVRAVDDHRTPLGLQGRLIGESAA
ncbi:MAG: metalloregulator ArsR/SmtB family transcription factor [Geminicoccaceae bacterium]|nr:metalloregulator ArsR/SmtB family transcription factor [Geminicoccaceae bacterium]